MTPVEPSDRGLNAALAAELRGERAAQDLTVEQLAQVSEIPYASLRRYLKATRDIDVSVLQALATALGTSPAELIRRAGDRLDRSVSGTRDDYTLVAYDDDTTIEDEQEGHNEP